MAAIVIGGVVLLYVMPSILCWLLLRKIAVVSGRPPEGWDILGLLLPGVNIIGVPFLYTALSTWLPGRRTFSELFFAIKKEHYWDQKEGGQ